ncbi:MAG: hypothetical protein EZS28_014852 [Streblomastix strix]|uniref:Uncharacterized protein n=1 Tax=Streblomastix strix TaxID=222440 RepID=A0A5J4W4M7_9EUKA|nr:MAG: hypothetical protein EZS28_014852 [Streblomastix strix]
MALKIMNMLTGTEFIIENSTLINIKYNYTKGFGALGLFLDGSEQKMTVNKCIFINCTSTEDDNRGGAIYFESLSSSVNSNKIIITNCLFINNSASQGGAIYSDRVPYQCNFSDNEFRENQNIGTDPRGYDALLQWYNYFESQTADQAKQNVQQLFNGSSSSYRNSIYYQFVIDDQVDASGYIDLEITQEYCKSKVELTKDCKCDPYSTTYSVAQCQKNKLCFTDLIHQPIDDCPCLSTKDPRANGTCPAYCDKGNVTKNCVCDSNIIDFTVEQCMNEKTCKFDLIHQSNATCPCLSTADPRANGTCPSYCVKGNLTSDCACDSNITDYSVESCQREKKCQFDLIHQSNATCPCLSTADPRANGTCPAYCIRGYVTSDCTCDTNLSSYPVDSCLKEKNCSFNLINQTTSDCPCQATGDPRAGDACPSYCVKGQVTSECVCDYYIPDFTIAQCQKEKLCITNLINQSTADCPCLSTGDPRANGACPAYCAKGQPTSECVCDTNQTSFTVQQCQKEKICLANLINQNTSDCPCLLTGDPRAGNVCPEYCIKEKVTSECVCDTNSSNFTFQQCQKEKLCITDLIHQTVADCKCLSTNDPRAGDTCPAYCIKGQTNQSCVCDTNASNFPIDQCLKENVCKYDLINQTATDCPCLSTGDPRAGKACPIYCTSKDKPTSDCTCDSNPNAQYPPSSCQSEKKCTQSSNSTVTKDSCTCSGSNHPTGCRCPSETTQLTGIPINQCECRSSDDPRAGSTCPAYCVKEQVNSSCVCDQNNTSFSYTTCKRDKICTINLINQSNITCPCLSTGDPRAGLGQCPAYCIKGQTNITCACDTGSTYYPIAQCNIDKLCITDLVHQSITDCPCMTQSDPRSESICKQSDPDPTDPIIPDPSEKDPETDQEQESGSKQEEDEKKTEKKESKTFNMIWIIFIVIGILAIAAIIIVKKSNKKKSNEKSGQPPDKQSQSSLNNINTGGRKEDESPISENSNSSDELKNMDNQVKDIESSE